MSARKKQKVSEREQTGGRSKSSKHKKLPTEDEDEIEAEEVEEAEEPMLRRSTRVKATSSATKTEAGRRSVSSTSAKSQSKAKSKSKAKTTSTRVKRKKEEDEVEEEEEEVKEESKEDEPKQKELKKEQEQEKKADSPVVEDDARSETATSASSAAEQATSTSSEDSAVDSTKKEDVGEEEKQVSKSFISGDLHGILRIRHPYSRTNEGDLFPSNSHYVRPTSADALKVLQNVTMMTKQLAGWMKDNLGDWYAFRLSPAEVSKVQKSFTEEEKAREAGTAIHVLMKMLGVAIDQGNELQVKVNKIEPTRKTAFIKSLYFDSETNRPNSKILEKVKSATNRLNTNVIKGTLYEAKFYTEERACYWVLR